MICPNVQRNIASSFVLADDTYALLDAVTVPSNKLSESFYLEVAFSTILAEENAGKKLVLEVGLENPSRYELTLHNTLTTVIVDVDAIRDKINKSSVNQ